MNIQVIIVYLRANSEKGLSTQIRQYEFIQYIHRFQINITCKCYLFENSYI